MNRLTDQQLLRDYTERQDETAFAELVRRHVDLIYSAALRMVRDAHLAQDVAQGVFVALAKNAAPLADRAVLSGWLHRTAQNLAANVVRSDVRRRRREEEAAAMNNLPPAESESSWADIAPHLDAALGELNDADRDALLLRYFEKKSALEMADILGISDEAAQKRVSRAVERLREFFSKRHATIGASGLMALITTNAVQSAPLGLAATVSAAALAGAAVTTSTAVVLTKAIAMTTLQKSLVAATIAVLAGTGIYEARQSTELRKQIETLKQEQASRGGQLLQLQQLQAERDEVKSQVAGLLAENARLRSKPNQNEAEVLRLRGQVAQLQHLKTKAATDDPFTRSVLALSARAVELNEHLQQAPDKKIPELQLLDENDWLVAAKDVKFDSEIEVRRAFQKLRELAKRKLPISSALLSFVHENNGQLPADLAQLKPYLGRAHVGDRGLDEATCDAVLARYGLMKTGKASNVPDGSWIVVEKAPVDKDYDSRVKFGLGTSQSISTGIGERGDPDDPGY